MRDLKGIRADMLVFRALWGASYFELAAHVLDRYRRVGSFGGAPLFYRSSMSVMRAAAHHVPGCGTSSAFPIACRADAHHRRAAAHHAPILVDALCRRNRGLCGYIEGSAGLLARFDR